MSISFSNISLPKVSASQIKTFALSILAAFVIMFMFSQLLFTVPSGFIGVKYSFGKISPDELQPGMHIIMPFADKVRLFDTKSQTVNYNGKSDKPDSDGIINLAGIGILDEKNLLIDLDVTIQFTPKSDKADEIVSQIGWNYYEKRLNSVVRDVVRDVAGRYQAETIASNRTEINSKMKTELARNMEGMPFVLNELSLRDIGLPKVIMEKVEAVQSAKQEEQRLGMVLKQTEQNQKISTMNAETKLIEATAAHAPRPSVCVLCPKVMLRPS